MAFDKTWIVLIAGCGVLGLAVWGGLNAITLKTILLWMFIGFGFLTFLMHLFGSPISILLGKFFHNSPDEQQTSQGILRVQTWISVYVINCLKISLPTKRAHGQVSLYPRWDWMYPNKISVIFFVAWLMLRMTIFVAHLPGVEVVINAI